MKKTGFEEILRAMAELSATQQALLLARLVEQEHSGSKGGLATLPGLQVRTTCPGCNGSRIGSWGSTSGLPRYRCRDCKMTFTSLSGTPLVSLRMREKWEDYARCLSESKTIRASAKECGISIPTAFRWRHRFLALIDKNNPRP